MYTQVGEASGLPLATPFSAVRKRRKPFIYCPKISGRGPERVYTAAIVEEDSEQLLVLLVLLVLLLQRSKKHMQTSSIPRES